MERIVKQVKMLKIYVPEYYVAGGQGFCGTWGKEKVYYKGNFISDEDTQTRFEQAKKEWDIEKNLRWGALLEKVVVNTWWENVEILKTT